MRLAPVACVVLALGGCHKLLPFPALTDAAGGDRLAPFNDSLLGLERSPGDGPQGPGWPVTFGGTSFPFPSEVALEASMGNAFVVGALYGVAHLAGQDQIASGSPDPLLVKVDSAGNLSAKVWKSTSAGLTAVATVGTAVVVAGQFTGTLQLGDACGSLTASRATGFVALLDANGACSAALKLVGGSAALPLAVLLQGSSDVFVTGKVKNGLTVGSCPPVPSKGPESIFLARLLIGGGGGGIGCTWARVFDHAQTVQAAGIGLASAGPNSFFTASFSGTVEIGATSLTSAGDLDGALVAFNPSSGSPIALAQIGGASKDTAGRVMVDATNTVFVTGAFTGPANFKNGCGSIVDTGQHGFLARYSFDGTSLSCTAVKMLGGSFSQSSGLALAQPPGSTSGLWVAGTFAGQLEQGLVSLPSAPAGATNGYLLHLDGSGAADWGTSFPPGPGQVSGMKADTSSALVVGSVESSTQVSVFDPNPTMASESGGLQISRCQMPGTCSSLDIPRGATEEGLAIAPRTTTGGVVVAGRFQTSLDPQAADVASGPEDIFVAEVGSLGKAVVKKLGGPGSERANAIVVDSVGDQYLAGSFDSAMTTPPLPVAVPSGRDIFVMKRSAGQVSWAKSFGGAGDDEATALALDGNGNVCVAGWFQKGITFGLNGLSANHGAFVACLNAATGEPVWSAGLTTGTGLAAGLALAADGTGGVFLGGSYSVGALQTIGPVTVIQRPPPVGGTDGFILLFGSSGNVVWSAGVGSAGDDAVQALAATSGALFAGGRFQGSASVGCLAAVAPLVGLGKQDGFLARLDLNSAGTACAVAWAKPIGSTSGDDQVTGLALHGSGDVFVVGSVGGVPSFGGVHHGEQDILVARFSSAGDYVTSWIYGDIGTDVGQAITVGAVGQVYFTGGFQRTVNFGVGPAASSHGGTDAFVMKLP
jgi:hypothetical protein